MFIAMNRFRIRDGHEDAFESAWRSRESSLGNHQGFVGFMLLRGDPVDGGTEFISHTTWTSRTDFDRWRNSEDFSRAHSHSGSIEGVMQGPPHATFFDVVLDQHAHAGAPAA